MEPTSGSKICFHLHMPCNAVWCNVFEYFAHNTCILRLSVTMNGSSILFINVYFPVAGHEKYGEYITCLGILSSILESHEEDHACILGDFNATTGSPRLMKFVTCYMRIM